MQDALAEHMGVSRVPIREALKTLEAEGQVTYLPHRGYFVTEMSLEELLETYRIRELLEDEAVRLAVPQLADEDFARMTEALRDIERAHRGGDLVAVTEANRRFHFALLDASGQRRLSNMIRMLWDSTDPYRSLYFALPNNRRRVNSEHRKIISAAKAKDIDQAVALLAEHRHNAIAGLTTIFEQQPAPAGGDSSRARTPRKGRRPDQHT